MKVRELIAALREMPPEMDVMVWDAEEDDFVGVTQALFEDGATDITLHTGEPLALLPSCPDDGHDVYDCPTGACRSAK